jgi:outer membrane protein assembly factor BamD (BamD/ComL family)
MKVVISALLVVASFFAGAGPAWGQVTNSPEGKAKAREIFRTATQHYDLGEFEEALRDFKEAYRHYEEPIFLFNVGQCHRQLGQKSEAVRFFKTYLAKSPNAPNKNEVMAMINKLEDALEQEHALQSGRPTGTLAPPESRLESKPPSTSQPESKPEPQQPTPAQTSTATQTQVVEKKPETPVYKKWWLWTAVGAVVVVGVGIGLGVGLSSSNDTPSQTTTFGTYKPF